MYYNRKISLPPDCAMLLMKVGSLYFLEGYVIIYNIRTSYYLIHVAVAVHVSCQELTSTLQEGNYTCPGKEVTFTCTISGSSGLALAWGSIEYIGQGNPLQFTAENMPGTTKTSKINNNVIATLTRTDNVDGVHVLESTLRIVAVLDSMVMCTTTGSTASKEFFVAGTYIHWDKLIKGTVSRYKW